VTRPTHNEYFLKVLETVRLRGTCDRGQNGALLVRHNRIVATGYVGAPRGLPHCDDVGHEFEWHGSHKTVLSEGFKSRSFTKHCVRTVHAEMNAIIQAARYGPPIDGATLYCYFFPCPTCAKVIVNAGIVKVISVYDYQNSAQSKQIFDESGVVEYSVIHQGEYNYDPGRIQEGSVEGDGIDTDGAPCDGITRPPDHSTGAERIPDTRENVACQNREAGKSASAPGFSESMGDPVEEDVS